MNKDFALSALRLMLNSRLFEEKTEELFKAGKIHGTTHLANGQEACQAGLCMALEDNDWIVPTHRCHGFTLCRGSHPYAMFSEMFGSVNGLAKGLGGSMHMPDRQCHNLGSSAVVGSGVPLATGLAWRIKRQNGSNISVAIFGDGATSRGSVHESMNLASVMKLPVLFFCENNKYGMSASADKMISIGKISDRASSYNMPGVTIDGNDFEQVYLAVKEACAYIRSGKGPYFIEALTYRQKGHSKSDKRLYRTAEEEALWLTKDPITLFEKKLISLGLFSEEEIQKTELDCKTGIELQAKVALEKSTEKLSEKETLALTYAKSPKAAYKNKEFDGTFRQAIRQAMDDEMSEDSNVVLLGEDIGIYGGCFKVSEGLIQKHPLQVVDTPVSEEGFTGMAVGAAMTGLKPIVEIMYADFFTLVLDPIVNHAAKTHFMSGGQFNCPIVVRLPEGSGTGHGAQHTQSPEALFMNSTGLKLVSPSNPNDAYHLLRAAIRDNNPVLFFENKTLYDTNGHIDSKPVEIGKANVLKKGKDLTIISYSRAVATALETAKILETKGLSCTVIDLRTLKPLDEKTILSEVQKTGRAVLIQDPNSFGGVNSQVCSLIATDKKTFTKLKGPIIQIGGQNSPVPFSKDLEKNAVPSVNKCVEIIEKSL